MHSKSSEGGSATIPATYISISTREFVN
uniref:Uncharacterized protein n=1 Tax=Rhizophora mucronata TaxID=61149 RepID=A0A2P2N1N5_RHIMU